MAANRNEGAWGEANREESGQGKININTASKEDLEQIQGIGSKRAEMIVQYRQQHGGFKSLDELNNIPRIGQELTDAVKQRLAA